MERKDNSVGETKKEALGGDKGPVGNILSILKLRHILERRGSDEEKEI